MMLVIALKQNVIEIALEMGSFLGYSYSVMALIFKSMVIFFHSFFADLIEVLRRNADEGL